MNEQDHERLQSLLAPSALGAVDPAERDEVEAHLDSCDTCRLEFGEHLEVVALFGGDAPPLERVWRKIADDIDNDRRAPPIDLAIVRRARRPPRWLGIAAGAVSLLGLGSALGRSVDGASGDPRDAREQVVDELGEATTTAGDLVTADGVPVARLVLASSGGGYLENAGLPRLRDGETYQLWALQDGEAVSVGVLGPSPEVVLIAAEGVRGTFAITAEPAGGVAAPTTEPLATGTLERH